MPNSPQIERGGRAVKPRLPEGLRLYVVGDIHGRLDLLEELAGLMERDARGAKAETIGEIFLGDYVDRGADSKGVIDWLTGTKAPSGGRYCLKGNHEAMMIAFFADAHAYGAWRFNGAPETLLSYGVSMTLRPGADEIEAMSAELRARMPDSHVRFFSQLKTSLSFGDYFFAHAGVRPEVSLEAQAEEDLLWIREDFLASDYDWGKIIVHGHTPVEEAEFRANRIGIDTGAYFSGKLTCLVLEGGTQRLIHT